MPPNSATLPTDADLDTPGAVRSLAYDRAWWFSRFVASRYGAESLRKLYVTACGPGHPDQTTAIKDALGAERAAGARRVARLARRLADGPNSVGDQ